MSLSASEILKAIVLRTTKYSESDLVVTVLTEQGVKVSMMARGALKSKKRFGGGLLEPTHFLKLTVRYKSERQGLGLIEDASLLEGFEELRSDYDKIQTAFWVLDIFLRSAQEDGVQEQGQFLLLGHGLRTLSKSSDLQKFKIHFGLRFLYLHGILEVESWMETFLKAPMNQALPQDLSINPGALFWVENKIESFLQSGSVS
jgi:DNA repair protein RecO (recombination protein O)